MTIAAELQDDFRRLERKLDRQFRTLASIIAIGYSTIFVAVIGLYFK